MKIKKIFIGFFVLFTLLFSTQALAAGTISVSAKGPLLSFVGMVDYKIVSQENNKVVISFDLFNQGEIQTGIKYGIKLVKEVNKSQFLVDEKVYDGSLTLLSGSNLKKEITYIAPSNLDGEYTILLTSRNEAGLIFGIASIGKVKLVSSVKGIMISPETCKLSIPGEKNKYIRYNLLEGVDISATESLQLNCNAINTDSKAITATPAFETHFRTLYGSIVPHTDVTNTPITFNAGEKKDISILLPKALKPQAYDLKVSLKYGAETSNTIVAHYVIQGVSATIQNLSLDKDFYEKGETAQMLFSWSQSADGFPGSRLGKASLMPEVYVDAKITNKYGLNCTDPIKQLLPVDHNTLKNDISAPIKRTCVNPKISISLVDKDGNVLDQKDFNVETSTREKSPIKTNIIIAGIILALVVIVTLVYLKNKKGKTPPGSTGPINIPVAMFILLFTLVSVGINFPVFKTDAYLMAVNGGGGGGSGGGTTVTNTGGTGTTPTGLAATISFDKTSYDPGTTARVTTSMYYTGCTNVTRDLVATGYITGNGYTGPTVELFNTVIHGQVGNTQDSYITVPSTPGDYTLKMEIKGYVPLSYSMSVTDSTITSTDFTQFKEAILNYLFDTEYSWFAAAHYAEIQDAADVDQLNAITGQSPLFFYGYKYGGELAFTRNYDFSPVKVKGVTLSINGVRSATVNYGGNAVINWNSINTTNGCTCTFSPANDDPTPTTSCGNSAANSTPYYVFSGDKNISNLKANTTFTVSCP